MNSLPSAIPSGAKNKVPSLPPESHSIRLLYILARSSHISPALCLSSSYSQSFESPFFYMRFVKTSHTACFTPRFSLESRNHRRVKTEIGPDRILGNQDIQLKNLHKTTDKYTRRKETIKRFSTFQAYQVSSSSSLFH
jgi:hypothetical protein